MFSAPTLPEIDTVAPNRTSCRSFGVGLDSPVVITISAARREPARSRFAAPDKKPRPASENTTMESSDIEHYKHRLVELRTEHRDLDDVIARLAKDPLVDELELKRLKKRKLMLKDMIAHLESRLIPDLNA
ncbi:MAG: YdcH family protein [Candidatus Competibacter sp.]|jgi:hypothetical protein